MKFKNRKQIRNTYILLLVVLAILPLNGMNTTLNNNYTFNLRWDYVLHSLAFIPLFPLLYFVSKDRVQRKLLFALGIVIFTEGIQYLLPYRTFNLNDLAANGFGLIIGISLLFTINKNKIYKHE